MGKQNNERCTSCSNHNKKFGLLGEIVKQGLQVTFNPNGCFVEDMKNQGKLIRKGERNGRMFTLDVNMPEVNSMLFTHRKGARDIGIWHKRIGHVNLQRLKLMEKQNLVGSLLKFGTEDVMSEVCEACQLGKQTRHPFCRTPTLAKCGGEAQHLQKSGVGVLRDSRMFRARQQGPKHLALGCSWCHWKGLEV
jgi:hypothetical protein